MPSQCPTKEVCSPKEVTTSKSDAYKTKETSPVDGNSGVSAGLGDAGNNEVPAIFEGKEQPAQIISDDGGDRVQGETSHSPVMQSQPEEVEPGKSAKQSNSVNGLRADAPNTDPVKKFRHLQFKLKLKGGVQSIC